MSRKYNGKCVFRLISSSVNDRKLTSCEQLTIVLLERNIIKLFATIVNVLEDKERNEGYGFGLACGGAYLCNGDSLGVSVVFKFKV